MSLTLIAVIVICGIVALAAIAVLLGVSLPGMGDGDNSSRNTMRTIVTAQRDTKQQAGKEGRPRRSVYETAAEVGTIKRADSRLTIEKKLRYATWTMTPGTFRILEIVISVVMVIIAHTKFNIVLTCSAAGTGPMFMNWLLNMAVDRRFKRFDADFAPFLLSLVGLLKTGMNIMGGIEAAAQGLEEGSLVRQQVELMNERLRFGVSEDKSIGSFGEDIYHPEIELFVQALLLSRRVGGTLSDTLDRLAKQVRKRQFFRSSAQAAVGMQRGSIWFIIGIMVFMELYLLTVYPQAVYGALADPVGWQVWQGGILGILFGIFWVRQFTKLKV